ncbi:transcription factor GATA-6 isoform X1 [Sabethes cyaneus]|uniref:transcription factor GATA-6 isoform X1 n=1 Tax=Sabethes cyaneus TaxID=53552 RepID=UPI00237DF90B|nr:transcription factor GATA-6 isoform X1 [Sabethes cyaneus]XP_053694764.1 transcription factor GATA-6 isoform X1 [Sabethes cyaneus]
MFTLLMICALAGGTTAGFASSQYAGAGTSSGLYNQISSNDGNNPYADKYPYTNTGFNGGFASNYVGPNVAGAAAGTGAFTPGFAPYQPIPAFPNAFDFNSFFQGLQANFANLYQQQLAHQNALFNSIRQQQAAFAANANSGNYGGATGGGGSGGNGAGFGAAGASASYGPSGFHQTAHIFPENPSSPNINTRFGSDAPPGGPGFVGVSSFSSSSNINGQSHREAATTVNDNGKVTSYHVRS